jgi:hypothetical protein
MYCIETNPESFVKIRLNLNLRRMQLNNASIPCLTFKNITMKFAAVLVATVSVASAFAPAAQPKQSTAMNALFDDVRSTNIAFLAMSSS